MWYRPDGREFEQGKSGLRPSDLRIAPRKKLQDTRIREIRTTMGLARRRTPDEDWPKLEAMMDEVLSDIHDDGQRLPEGRGLFPGETDGPSIESNEAGSASEARPLSLRPASRVFMNTNLQAIDREQRKTRGRANTDLLVGNFVTCKTFYEEKVPQTKRNDFWLGKIVEIDLETKELRINWWNTSTTRNRASRAKYRAWTGKHKSEWIKIDRVLHTFDSLSQKSNMIRAHDVRRTGLALDADDGAEWSDDEKSEQSEEDLEEDLEEGD
jgi:hypothetical protein